MKRTAILLLLLFLVSYGDGIAALCAENGLAGRVVWVSDVEGDLEIFFMDLAEGYPYQLTASEGADLHPALSPDGEKLAWVSEKDGRADIYLMDLNDRLWDRLTDTPGVESDLSWSADGERIYYSSYEAIDYGTVGLYAGSTGELEHLAGREHGFAAYYYDLNYRTEERLSLFSGDFRSPVHVSGLGVVCRYEPWSAEVSPFPAGLVLIHDALACDPLGYYEGLDFAGPLRRFTNGDLLVPYISGEWFCYDRIEPNTGEMVCGWWYSTGDRLNGTPDPAGGNWLLCQTAAEGDPASEILLLGSGNDSEPQVIIQLTDNASYDGEPTWAALGGE
jgi:WD40 repeat protein